MPAATAPKKKGKSAAEAKKLQQALDDMIPELRNKTEDILGRISALEDSDIEKRYEIGRDINEVLENKSGIYGADPWESMGTVLRLSKDSIKGMTRVADTFTERELGDLRKMANPVTREKLRWNHIVTLARVPDKQKAFSYALKAVESGWSTKDLVKHVTKVTGGKKSGGGRPSKKFATFEETVADVETKARNVANSAESVWLSPGGLRDQYKKEAEVEGFRPTSALVTQIDRAQAELERLGLHVSTTLTQITQLSMQAKAARERPKLTE